MSKNKLSEKEWIKLLSDNVDVAKCFSDAMASKTSTDLSQVIWGSLEDSVRFDITKCIWDSFKDIIVEKLNTEDKQVSIPHFGTFVKATHKGHPLNLNLKDSNDSISDYETFKFKPDARYKAMVLGKSDKTPAKPVDNKSSAKPTAKAKKPSKKA